MRIRRRSISMRNRLLERLDRYPLLIIDDNRFAEAKGYLCHESNVHHEH